MLQILTNGIQKTISVLESKASTPLDEMGISHSTMEGGLISLPVEILCVIAKEIQGDPDEIRLPLILPFSHTCQKLRGAALSFSGLWTTISSDFTKPLLETYLTRSQNLPLNVIIHVDWDYKTQNMLSSLEQFILHVAQHSNRWGGFYSSHGWVPPQLSQIYKLVHQATSRDANTCHSSERCIF